MKRRLPEFLIIGAARAGTTSLYNDLRAHPAIFLPALKEIGKLRYDRVLSEKGVREYSGYFKRARSNQLCGEASTAYSKIPYYSGVPERAHALLGPGTKIIYLVREPIARLVSYHRHIYASGWVTENINEALREYPYLVDFSRYHMQLAAWLEFFPADNIRVVQFEGYCHHRHAVIEDLVTFLGLRPFTPSPEELTTVFNGSEERRQINGLLYRLSLSKPYTQVLKPMMSPRVRAILLRYLSRPARRPVTPLMKESEEWVRAELLSDQKRFARLIGVEDHIRGDKIVNWPKPVRRPVKNATAERLD